MRITSSAFEDGARIPEEYTRDGEDRSPPLTFRGVPEEARSIALIVDDPDAPSKTWVHWLAWGIPADAGDVPADLPKEGVVESFQGVRQGKNDFDEIGYGGPLPPEGHGTHHYRFTGYALDRHIDLDAGAGREARLVDLALKNARRGGRGTDRARDEAYGLADALSGVFPDLGRVDRIEGFDVSHAQGKAVVGSNVCFVDGSPEKSAYRRKKLDDRNDDYGNMRTLVAWRAERAVDGTDDRPNPDLLLVDGGEGQLNAARDALAAAGWDVPCIALAKAEELVVTHDGTFDWPSDAPHLHLLQRVRDEAHRFAVQYHQTVRDEVSTALDGVPGVGPKTRTALLRRFGSVENVRAASVEDLRSVDGVGPETARTLKRRL